MERYKIALEGPDVTNRMMTNEGSFLVTQLVSSLTNLAIITTLSPASVPAVGNSFDEVGKKDCAKEVRKYVNALYWFPRFKRCRNKSTRSSISIAEVPITTLLVVFSFNIAI